MRYIFFSCVLSHAGFPPPTSEAANIGVSLLLPFDLPLKVLAGIKSRPCNLCRAPRALPAHFLPGISSPSQGGFPQPRPMILSQARIQVRASSALR